MTARPIGGNGNGGDSARYPAVLVEDVSKQYAGFRLFGSRRHDQLRYALRNVSFTLEDGETLGLLGPNGAGKTTLLKIICTLLAPSSGRVLLHGIDVAEKSLAARRQLGLITCDERSFYWRLTGRQNLVFFAALYGIPERTAAERIDVLLEVLGLSAAADRPFLGYSSGMKQKLAIARGLMNQPRIVLYDEPTRALDPLSAQQIRRWIKDNQTRAPHQAHLLATNQLHEAEQLCNRVIIINRGTVIALGTVAEIRENWRRHDFAVHTISCRGARPLRVVHPAPELGLLDIAIERPSDDIMNIRLRTIRQSEGLHYVLADIVDAGGTILRCDSEAATFDDVFCALVAHNTEESAAAVAGAAR